MGRVQDMVTSVREEAQFDTTETAVLRALNSRHMQMVTRARCFRQTLRIGPTIADQADYDLPAEVLEVLELSVAGTPYGNARHVDISLARLGYVCMSGPGGVASRTDSEWGEKQVRLYPTPTEAGDDVLVLAVCRPPALSLTDDSTLKIPVEYDEKLEAGAIGRLLRRLEHRPDLAVPHEQEFADGCEELRRQVNREFRGPGPASIRVINRYG